MTLPCLVFSDGVVSGKKDPVLSKRLKLPLAELTESPDVPVELAATIRPCDQSINRK